jgi:DNA-binding response OmpR family regulator
MYPGMRSITLGTEPVELTKLEYDLMLFLAEHPRTVFTRLQLLQGVWGHLHAGVRTVDVHIRRLRAKLRDDLVITVRWGRLPPRRQPAAPDRPGPGRRGSRHRVN